MSRQRAVRQQLEDLRRAGVTHIPASVARQMLEVGKSPAASPPVRPTMPITKSMPTATRSTAAAPGPEQRTTPSRDETTPILVSNPPLRLCVDLTREQRVAQLKDIATRVAQCTRCTELARHRTQTVFGVGNPEAKIMFIGEAPGADEDQQGEPFVGAAGQLLDKITLACKLRREDIYICNVLRCRPPGNRTPAPDEAANCREYLDAQIATVNPQFIVCWGAVAAQNLLNSTLSIGKMRGKFFDHFGIQVLCTYHPSYLLRNPAAKKDVWEDMKFFRRAQGVNLD